MKVLVIEDDAIKASRVVDFLRSANPTLNIEIRSSYQSGLLAVRTHPFDLLVLDMTLPVYDVTGGDRGYKHLPFAGRLIIRELFRREIRIRIVVVTQYNTFAEQIEMKTLDELDAELRDSYGDRYLGAVFYSEAQTEWRDKLNVLIGDILSGNENLRD